MYQKAAHICGATLLWCGGGHCVTSRSFGPPFQYVTLAKESLAGSYSLQANYAYWQSAAQASQKLQRLTEGQANVDGAGAAVPTEGQS